MTDEGNKLRTEATPVTPQATVENCGNWVGEKTAQGIYELLFIHKLFMTPLV